MLLRYNCVFFNLQRCEICMMKFWRIVYKLLFKKDLKRKEIEFVK